MMYNSPYYAPYYRPTGYYNPSIPQDNQNLQGAQNYPQVQMQQPPQAMSIAQPAAVPSNDMLWVLNETEATSYPVAPNNSVTLWDKNKDTVYIKSVNMQGVPSMRILDYTERTSDTPSKSNEHHECKCGSKFVSVETFKALQAELQSLREEIEELKTGPKAVKSEV